MDREKLKQKYGISRTIAILMQVQMCLVGMGLVISAYGMIKAVQSPTRLIVYCLQALTCLVILIFGLFLFTKRDIRYFKGVVIFYAVLEGVRCALLRTGGVDTWSATLAKLLLVALACCAVVLGEHLGEEKNSPLGYLIVFLETALFLIFALGFPGVEANLIYKILPIAGILIAGSIVLFNEAKIRQIKYFEEEEGRENAFAQSE